MTFEGCKPWTESGDAYEPELLDGRRLWFHDMDLLRIELDPEARTVTFWFCCDRDAAPAELVAVPVARLMLHRARIVEWVEDPVEELPPGVGRQVNGMAFEAPNLLLFDSLNLHLQIEIQHVSLAVLPAGAG